MVGLTLDLIARVAIVGVEFGLSVVGVSLAHVVVIVVASTAAMVCTAATTSGRHR